MLLKIIFMGIAIKIFYGIRNLLFRAVNDIFKKGGAIFTLKIILITLLLHTLMC